MRSVNVLDTTRLVMSTSLVSTYFIANFFQTVNYAGALKTQVLENASTEKASTMQTFSQIKKFGTSQVSVVHFQVGWASGLQIVFF